jgi:hypothetical protein
MIPEIVNLVTVAREGDDRLRLNVDDGTEQLLDFYPFLARAVQPDIRAYLDPAGFADFRVEYGELVWGDYALCFPMADLDHNRILHRPEFEEVARSRLKATAQCSPPRPRYKIPSLSIPKPRIVALLPMKAHSARVTGKHFRDFRDKPLFRWMLDTLLSIKDRSTPDVPATAPSRLLSSVSRTLGWTVLSSLQAGSARLRPLTRSSGQGLS